MARRRGSLGSRLGLGNLVDYVIEKIHELKSELNLQHLAAWSTPPGMPHEISMKSIKLFNEKVIPHFKDSNTEIKKVS